MCSMNRSILWAILILLIPSACRAADDPAPLDVYGCDGRSLAEARKRWLAGDPQIVPIVKELRDNAQKALADGPYSVAWKKHTLPGVDPHDYVSIAPYFWPNPDTPNHLPYIARDGQRNPEFNDYDAKPLMDLTDHVYAMALTGYLTGDQKFFDRAAALMRVWFIDPATRMNPNLDHTQVVQGIDQGRGMGIIESRRFISMIDATALMRDNRAWSADDQQNFTAWIKEYLHWLLESKNGNQETDNPNNHGSWYDVQVVTYSMFVGDSATARQYLERAKTRRIAKQIEPDGQQPLEIARTRSFGYCVFNLTALSELADVGRRMDVDLWNYQTPDGRCIRKAIDFLLPFAMGDATWTHPVVDGFSAKGLVVPLRRAEPIYHEQAKYEAVISRLKGWEVPTDEDREHPLLPQKINLLLFVGGN
jgi:hypothetical protein